MAQVWQALNSLSKTVGDRGGVADAMLRGADASLGLKKAEYDIARGQAADKRAAETFDMTKQEHEARMPGVELQAQKDKSRMEMVTINANEIVPQDLDGITHFFKKAGDGESLDSLTTKGLPGSGYDDKGDRVNKDGSVVMIPRWQKEERYLPAIMAVNMARIDPIKKIEDGIFKGEQSLTGLAPNTPEYADQKKKVDTLRAVLADPKQLATLHAQKASKLQEMLAWGIANNARPDFMNIMKSEADKAQTNYEKYSKTMTKEEKAVFDADLDLKKAHAAYYKGAARKAGRDPVAKGLSFTERKAMGESAIEDFGLSHGLDRDPMTSKFSGGSFSDKEAEELLNDADESGLKIYFEKNKDGKRSITGMVPKAGFGQQQNVGDETVPVKDGKTVDFTKAATEINAKAPDMPLRDIGMNLKSGGLGPDEIKRILIEVDGLRKKGSPAKTDVAPVEKSKGIFYGDVDLNNPLSRGFAKAMEKKDKYNEARYGSLRK